MRCCSSAWCSRSRSISPRASASWRSSRSTDARSSCSAEAACGHLLLAGGALLALGVGLLTLGRQGGLGVGARLARLGQQPVGLGLLALAGLALGLDQLLHPALEVHALAALLLGLLLRLREQGQGGRALGLAARGGLQPALQVAARSRSRSSAARASSRVISSAGAAPLVCGASSDAAWSADSGGDAFTGSGSLVVTAGENPCGSKGRTYSTGHPVPARVTVMCQRRDVKRDGRTYGKRRTSTGNSRMRLRPRRAADDGEPTQGRKDEQPPAGAGDVAEEEQQVTPKADADVDSQGEADLDQRLAELATAEEEARSLLEQRLHERRELEVAQVKRRVDEVREELRRTGGPRTGGATSTSSWPRPGRAAQRRAGPPAGGGPEPDGHDQGGGRAVGGPGVRGPRADPHRVAEPQAGSVSSNRSSPGLARRSRAAGSPRGAGRRRGAELEKARQEVETTRSEAESWVARLQRGLCRDGDQARGGAPGAGAGAGRAHGGAGRGKPEARQEAEQARAEVETTRSEAEQWVAQTAEVLEQTRAELSEQQARVGQLESELDGAREEGREQLGAERRVPPRRKQSWRRRARRSRPRSPRREPRGACRRGGNRAGEGAPGDRDHEVRGGSPRGACRRGGNRAGDGAPGDREPTKSEAESWVADSQRVLSETEAKLTADHQALEQALDARTAELEEVSRGSPRS